jgi:epoxyqueuosine reductase
MGIVVGSIGKNGYKPPLIHRILKPRITGDEVNGLGEKEWRRPRFIYHWVAKAPRVAFYWLQAFFYWRDMRISYFRERLEEGFANMAKPRAPVAPERVEDTAENWVQRIREFSLANEADEVGFTELKQEWVYEGFEIKQKWIIVLGVTEGYQAVASAPAHESNREVLDQYNRGHRAAMKLADWLREQGWAAECHQAFIASPVAMIPAAIAAGFGELGKHGSIINRKHGPRIRLGYVITDLPLVAGKPDELHVDDFCLNCKLCTRECPPDAIFSDKQLVRGVEKWYVSFDKCVPYFNDTFGCNICIKVCPFSRPGVSAPLFDKIKKRHDQRLAQD